MKDGQLKQQDFKREGICIYFTLFISKEKEFLEEK